MTNNLFIKLISSLKSIFLNFSLWLILGIFISFNVIYFTKFQFPLAKLISNILENPFAIDSHLALATNYRLIGAQDLAKKELLISLDLWQQNSTLAKQETVLGISINPITVGSNWNKFDQDLLNKYTFWKNIVTQKPEYRDAYIQLGIYAYQLGRTQEAKNVWQKALQIDHNYKLSDNIETFIAAY